MTNVCLMLGLTPDKIISNLDTKLLAGVLYSLYITDKKAQNCFRLAHLRQWHNSCACLKIKMADLVDRVHIRQI